MSKDTDENLEHEKELGSSRSLKNEDSEIEKKNSESLEKEQIGVEFLATAFRQVQSTYYQGPIPHPELFRQFDEVRPGLTDLIIESWKAEKDQLLYLSKEEQKHRHRWENKALNNDIIIQSGGLILGWLLAILCVVLYIILVIWGYGWYAAPLLGIPVFAAIQKMVSPKKTEKNKYQNLVPKTPSNEN